MFNLSSLVLTIGLVQVAFCQLASLGPGINAPGYGFGDLAHTPTGFGGWGGSGYPGVGTYGGVGTADIAVAGEIPVAGSTVVVGQVPVRGSVGFSGPIPAGGILAVSGSCNCGVNGAILN
ncbi:PREDICTED: chorion class CA protein ERA.2-like [Papilio xuthus]|uniref:Chorion class CA protein ERA.2-like n=1 Tax=Papilio xuthus TaxID=66420 RepID=A0AAJ7EFQ1_PAPXU|nr:PREDICTED: chorion class CA protein ERA.2-like [Papilio xuthus]